MRESANRKNSVAEQKAKIRKRYQGINQDKLEKIPAIPRIDFYDDEREKRVAVYARVSTDDPRQTSSYEFIGMLSVKYLPFILYKSSYSNCSIVISTSEFELNHGYYLHHNQQIRFQVYFCLLDYNSIHPFLLL